LEKNISPCGFAQNAALSIVNKAATSSHWPLKFHRWKMEVAVMDARFYTVTTMENIVAKDMG
jgi:hypothetical protein